MADYLFIDLHMHSSYSSEDLCDESPRHILNKVQEYVDKYNLQNNTNVNCCISIADHNSIMASVDAQKILSSGLFPNVKYINGCEFTTDLCELNDKIGLPNCFTRCHILAYNYDEKDKELQAYSKITHKRFTNEDNVGLQILASRRAVCEEFNIYIPFSNFLKIAGMGRNSDYYSTFISIVKDYFYKNNIKFDRDRIDKCIMPYLVGARSYVEKATDYGRLKLSEVSRLVRNAGGKIVLAHPSIIKISIDGAEKILNKHNENLTIQMTNLKAKGKARDVVSKLGNSAVDVILKEFLDAALLVCDGRAIDGLESLIGINFLKNTTPIILKKCLEHNAFQTAGSDYHGEHFSNHKMIGNCLTQGLQDAWGVDKAKLEGKNLFIRVSNLPFVDYCIEGKDITSFDAKFIDEQFTYISWEELEKFIVHAKNEAKKKSKQKKLSESNGEIKKHIENLTEIAEKYSEILNKQETFDKRRKMVVKLEKFCYSIYKGLQNFLKKFREHSEDYDAEDVKKITTLLKETHRKYFEMTRLDNGAISYVKNKLSLKENKTIALTKLANITITTKKNKTEEKNK